MANKNNNRQNVRRGVLVISLLLFPITMNYLSPYVIMFGASQGIVNGSMIMFGLMFLSSLFFGRLWCAWLCPGGAIGMVCTLANDNTVKHKWLDTVKWVIWFIWLGAIAFFAISAGGYKTIDPFLLTEDGISISDPTGYFIYYTVIGIFIALAWIAGRRGGCHTICWMAPFMIVGRRIRNLFAWPSYRLRAVPDSCIDCLKCTRGCPMSLDVHAMVQKNSMENVECILCATCADACPTTSINFEFSSGK